MENALNFLFEKRKLEDIEDFSFKGLRCSDDVMYKLIYIIGELCGIPSVYVSIDDEEEGVDTYVCDIDKLKGMEDIAPDGYDDEEPNDIDNLYSEGIYEETEDNICDN